MHLLKQKKKADAGLLYLVLVLSLLGLVAIADASAPLALSVFADKFYFLKQQAVWVIVGLVLMLVVSQINYRVWEKLATPLFIFSLVFLLVVLIPNFGFKALGARRWLDLGPLSFQPSEVVKLTLAIFLAKMATKKKRLISYLLFLGLCVGLIMLQPDLGTALIVTAIAFVQIFISGINLFKFMGLLLAAGAISLLLIIVSPYRRDRLQTFLQITSDPLGKSYHIRQVLLALGSGGLSGVGLGQSRQKYLFLPEAATDSIFAIIAEEVGFLGSLLLIALLGLLLVKIFRLAGSAPDEFSQILAGGILTWIAGQILLNLGSMTALVPLTGIPLPFFSYGGTSLVMLLISCGILLNISKYAVKKK